MNKRMKEAFRGLLPRSIGQRRILGGPLRGRPLVTSWYDYPAAILGLTERPLLDWFASNVRAGETWLDIGAHYGYTAIALCRLVGPAGGVYAFEPMVASAGCIVRTRALNRLQQLTVVPVALGNSADLGIQSLPQVRGMVDSTFTGISFEEFFLVATLDWLWPRICGRQERVDGVKIDVQGMEISVLRGMTGILRRYRPKLVIELHKRVSRPELLTLLAGVGYSEPGLPIEPLQGESDPQYADDHSYAFLPNS